MTSYNLNPNREFSLVREDNLSSCRKVCNPLVFVKESELNKRSNTYTWNIIKFSEKNIQKTMLRIWQTYQIHIRYISHIHISCIVPLPLNHYSCACQPTITSGIIHPTKQQVKPFRCPSLKVSRTPPRETPSLGMGCWTVLVVGIKDFWAKHGTLPSRLPQFNMVHLKMAPWNFGDYELGKHHFQVPC